MATKKAAPKKVIIPVESIPVETLPSIIDEKGLQALTIPEQIKQNLIPYKSLKINGIEDRLGYKQVETARKEIKAARVSISKEAKMIRDEANQFQKRVIAKEKELLDEINPVEEHLENEAAEFERLNEELRQKQLREQQEKIHKRSAMLLEFMEFNGENYSYRDRIMDSLTVSNATDTYFETFYLAARELFDHDREEAEKDELLRIQLEQLEQDIIKMLTDIGLTQSGELFRTRYDSFLITKNEIRDGLNILDFNQLEEDAKIAFDADEKKYQDEQQTLRDMEATKKKLADDQEKLRKQQQDFIDGRLNVRRQLLASLGFLFNGSKYFFHHIEISAEAVANDEEDVFKAKYDNFVIDVNVAKEAELQRQEIIRQAELKKAAADAIFAEQNREALARQKEIEDKVEADRKAALAPDKEKALLNKQVLIDASIKMQEMSTPAGKKLNGDVRALLFKVRAYIDDQISKW